MKKLKLPALPKIPSPKTLKARLFPTYAKEKKTRVIRLAETLPDLGPHASRPERLLAKALQERNVPYTAQVQTAGGRGQLGGMVVDFVLPTLKKYLRVQGEYWHGSVDARAKDDAQTLYLTAQGYDVVDIWAWDIEHRLYDYVLPILIGV